MVIDSHQHVFWWYRDDAGLVADLDEHNIDLAWLLTWHIHPAEASKDRYFSVLNPLRVRPDGTHAGITLEDCLKCRDNYPDRFVIGYCPHPLLGNAPELFEAAYKMYGVRVCGEWKFRMLFDDPRCINLYRKAGELGCPVVLHLDVPYLKDENGERQYDDKWYGGTVANLERALAACPETIFYWSCTWILARNQWGRRERSRNLSDRPGGPRGKTGSSVRNLSKLVRRPVGRLSPCGTQ